MERSSSRRDLLSVLAGVGISSLAGCEALNDMESNPNSSSNTEISPADAISPTIETIQVADWPGDTIDSKALTVTGTVSDDTGISQIEVELNTGVSDTQDYSNDMQTSFMMELPIEGGQSYTGTLTVTDATAESNTAQRTFDTGEIPAAKAALEHDRLVGAHYYPWYGMNDQHWDSGYTGTPILGEYDSRNKHVIDQHIQWARQYGINWFSVSWWGQSTFSGGTLRNYFLDATLASDIDFSILYEPIGRFNAWDGDRIDIDDPTNRERLFKDFTHLAETYFEEDNYLQINGRPVVYIYATHVFEGALPKALDELRSRITPTPYIIGEMINISGPKPRHRSRIAAFDAITTYNPSGVLLNTDISDFEMFLDRVQDLYREWFISARAVGTAFIPPVIPGFDKTENKNGNPDDLIERSHDRFSDLSALAREVMDPDLEAVLITSFNEWHEGTTVEPAEEYGTSYLEDIPEFLVHADYESYLDEVTPLRLEFNRTVQPDGTDRQLAFLIDHLTFVAADGSSVLEYDIGTRDEEPHLPFGAYGREAMPDNDLETYRWLGGPNEATELYVDSAATQAAKVVLHGRPKENGVTADIFWKGEKIKQLDFGQPDSAILEYSVPL